MCRRPSVSIDSFGFVKRPKRHFAPTRTHDVIDVDNFLVVYHYSVVFLTGKNTKLRYKGGEMRKREPISGALNERGNSSQTKASFQQLVGQI